jgi:hypothetical protein
VPARLYELNASAWLAPTTPTASKLPQLNGVTVFPNPAHHSVQIQSKEGFAPNTSVVLQNLQGQTILTSTLSSGNLGQQVDIQKVVAGIYLIRVQSDKGIFVRKLVVQ